MFKVELSQALAASTAILAVLSGVQAARAQDHLPAPPLLDSAEKTEAVDPAALREQRFVSSVAQAVIRLEAKGDRTVDAIENSQIALTFGSMPDRSRLSVLCNNDAQALNAFVQSIAGDLQLKGKVSEAACTGAGRDDDPFGMKFRLHYESGDTSLFYEQAPELPLVVEEPGEDNREVDSASIDDPPPQPVVLNRRRERASHAIVQLSQGWTPVKLPDSVHADSAFGTFDSKVTFSEGVLAVDRKLVLKREKVEVAELPTFEKWEESITEGASVALRSTLFYPERDASAGTEEQKKAAALIDEAYRDIQAHELAKAEIALNHAEEVDPGHEILHENRGALAEARRDYVTALAEYRKELEAFPNALIEMGSIALVQRKLGDVDGSFITLQRWMVADPNSYIAATTLMQLYHNMDRDDLAVQVGDEAMNIMTRDAKRSVDFLLTYGHEQMLTGHVRDAESTLEALLDFTVDDKIVNDAAYFLSEQGLSLDRAERSVREALAEFDPDNTDSALSTSYANGTERTSLLFATWDTLGWILYRKGAVHEAEMYVRAAWHGRQDIAISRHLGEILTAEDKPVDAMDVYTLGLAAIAGQNAAQMVKNRDAIAVRDSLEKLKQQGHATTVKDPKAALLALRTLDLGVAAKRQARTPCSVSLTATRLIIRISERNGDEEPIVVSDQKMLAGFFPPDSKAALNLKGTIQCDKSCSLELTP